MSPKEKIEKLRNLLLDIIDNAKEELPIDKFKHQREAFQAGHDFGVENFASMLFNTIFKDD